jgi:hypothetical protein
MPGLEMGHLLTPHRHDLRNSLQECELLQSVPTAVGGCAAPSG